MYLYLIVVFPFQKVSIFEDEDKEQSVGILTAADHLPLNLPCPTKSFHD